MGRRFLGCGAQSELTCNAMVWCDPQHTSRFLRHSLVSLSNQVRTNRNDQLQEKLRKQVELNEKAKEEADQFLKQRRADCQGISIQMMHVIGRLRHVAHVDNNGDEEMFDDEDEDDEMFDDED